MASKDESEPGSAPPNREQRRREKFGNAGKVHQHNPLGPWPEIEANPALKNVVSDQAPVVAADEEDVTPKAAPETAAVPAEPTKTPRPASKPVTKTALG
jgi:hypothetical protein